MTTLNDLIEYHEISQLKYRYLRAVDTHDWDLLATCFTQDAKVWYASGAFSHDGRDNIVKFLSDLMPDAFVGSHVVMHPEITLTSPTTATGVWRLQDIVHFLEPNPVFTLSNIHGGEEMTGAGYYYDDYVKTDEGWKCSSMGYERLFEVIEPREGRPGLSVKTDPLFGRDRRGQ